MRLHEIKGCSSNDWLLFFKRVDQGWNCQRTQMWKIILRNMWTVNSLSDSLDSMTDHERYCFKRNLLLLFEHNMSKWSLTLIKHCLFSWLTFLFSLTFLLLLSFLDYFLCNIQDLFFIWIQAINSVSMLANHLLP